MLTTTETIDTEFAEVDQVIAEANEKLLSDEYRDLINEFETVTKLLLEEITDTIEQRYDMGVRFPEKWRRSLCRQAEMIRHAPSLIICSAAPAGYEALGSRVLEFVAELENDSPFAFLTLASIMCCKHCARPKRIAVRLLFTPKVCRALSKSGLVSVAGSFGLPIYVNGG
jgi:hypothetical protein